MRGEMIDEGRDMPPIDETRSERKRESRLETEVEEYPKTDQHENGLVKIQRHFHIDDPQGREYYERRDCYEGEQVQKQEKRKWGYEKYIKYDDEKNTSTEKGRDLDGENAWTTETQFDPQGKKEESVTTVTQGENEGRTTKDYYSYWTGTITSPSGKEYTDVDIMRITNIVLETGPVKNDRQEIVSKIVVFKKGTQDHLDHWKETKPESGKPSSEEKESTKE